jgi:Response receiver domain
MPNEHYSRFIEEAFIKPIRSVLIVDDDYPTLDELLDLEIAQGGHGRPPRTDKKWYDNPQRIKRVIEGFRRPERPMLLDIHDGANVDAKGDAKVASHLHQSDLLVLDYQLDKARPQDGTRAIGILRGLISNDHFNLVVVHTSEQLDLVYREVILGLLGPMDDHLTDEQGAQVNQLIADREEVDEDFLQSLRTAVTVDQYLHARRYATTYMRTMGQGMQPYSDFCALAEAAGWNNGNRKLVLRRLLADVEEPLRVRMREVSAVGLKWATSGVKWVKAASVFIAFSNKTDHDDLFVELQTALESWNPAPSRLFMAKLRAEMDEYGVVAQTEALERKHALAYWYARLLRSNGDERRWLIAESVSRHSDQLLNTILRRVETFATALVDAESAAAGENIDARCQDHFSVDLSKSQPKKTAELEHNAFVSSKAPEGWHLTTGHIFTMNEAHWICLSPACDLVPGQGKSRSEGLGDRIPFMAVKLHSRQVNGAHDANSNLYIFLTLDDEVQKFCFNSQDHEATSPLWRTLYAERRGLLEKDFKFKVSMVGMGSRRLISTVHAAQVVAQLRYEYALNLQQKLGVAMTRIGLDFV